MDEKMMKKLMILGAGYSQLPLIRAAKNLGYHTIVTSIPGDYPGFSLGDECCYADISKPEEVLREAKKLGISGITTCGMDTGIRAAGKVCDALGLPGITYEGARILSNKYESKRSFEKSGVPCARGMKIQNKQELEQALQKLTFPVVLKAVDLMGSRGIYRCDTREEALANYEKVRENTKQDYCLAEEFLTGLLFGAEGMLTDGKLTYLLPYGTDIYHESTIATSIGHFTPYLLEYQKEIEETLTKALLGAGVKTTPFNCDLMLKDGRVYLIEINGRAGASCLSETVGIYYGVNYYEILCRQAIGESVDPYFQRKEQGTASISRMLTAEKNGILKAVRIPEKQPGEPYELMLNAEPGDAVRFYQNGSDRLGQLIVWGETLEYCRKKLLEVLSGISFQIQEEL
jgi:biotin carboxylase